MKKLVACLVIITFVLHQITKHRSQTKYEKASKHWNLTMYEIRCPACGQQTLLLYRNCHQDYVMKPHKLPFKVWCHFYDKIYSVSQARKSFFGKQFKGKI